MYQLEGFDEKNQLIQGHLLKSFKIKRGQTHSLRETFEFNKFENQAEKSFFVQD